MGDVAPKRLKRYALTEKIGCGRNGEVYRGFDMDQQRVVAVKLLRKDVMATHQFQKQAIARTMSATRIDHPNVVNVAVIEKVEDKFDTPVGNPVDLYFSVTKIGFTKTLEITFPAAIEDPNIDAAILMLAGFDYTEEAVQKKIVQKIVREVGKPVVICLIVGYNKYKNVIMDELGKDLPVFPSLISGVKALSKLCQYSMFKNKKST